MSMSYSTTTVSRRRFMVKANRPGKSQSTPARSSPDAADSSSSSSSGADSASGDDSGFSAGRASSPELFLRTSYRRPLRVAPTPWWKNWLAVTLVNAMVVAAVGGLYVWANGADSDESGAYVPRRLTARPPSTINTRSAESSPAAPAPLAKARQAADSSAVDEIDRALRDGSRKVILPTNVAGNCSIGGSDSKDFGRCLAENGARAQ